MNPERSRWQNRLNLVISCLCSLSLVLGMLPCSTAQAVEDERWSNTIDEMLASGEYAEDEAIVALKGNEDGALTAQASLPIDDLEPLMEVGASAVGAETNVGSGLTAQGQEGATIALVTSETLSTEEILRSLADDPRVVFAEPNYYAELLDDEQVETAEIVAAEVVAGDEDDTVEEVVVVEPAPVDEATPSDQQADDGSTPTDEETDAAPATPVDGATGEPITTEEDVEAATVPDDAEQETPEATAETNPTETAPTNEQDLAIVAQASSSAGDLTALQWGNWDTSQSGVSPLGDSSNHSVNVPSFGASDVGANMDEEIVVAVLDGAIDFTNPDLADRAYTFSSELQAELGCDEHGYNASAESTDGKIVHHYDFSGDSHGTHCAGIIGATWDGHGVSGVASNVKIISIQMMGSLDGVNNGRTSLANGVRAFAFVKRANDAGVGIRVTSSSWGFYQVSKALDAAMRELGETQGVVSVFAAFNDAKNNDSYAAHPSTYADNPYAIVVGATDQYGELASFSNYGENTVTLAAPGEAILSTDVTVNGIYLPAATPESNIVFEDFEDDTPVVSIQQVDVDGNSVNDPSSICTDMHLMGSQGLKVPFDASVVIPAEDGGWSFIDKQIIRIDIDIEAAQAKSGINIIESLRNSQELYLGFGLTTNDSINSVSPLHVTTNMTGDEELSTPNNQTGASGSMLYSMYTSIKDEDAELDLDHLDGHLIIDICVNALEGTTELYFDSVGIGIEKVPYVYKGGTSMACPCISGATAVLASQTGFEGVQLASLVRSKVRIPDDGPMAVRTGGMFDFTVEGSPDDGGAEAISPVIASCEVDGTTVTFTGSNFGSNPGSVELSRYIVGVEQDEDSLVALASGSESSVGAGKVSAAVTSWSDEQVVLALDEPFVGIMRAVLSNASGKYDTVSKFVSKGENVYEQDLPFPSGTGDPFEYADQVGDELVLGDYETKGPLVGLGCKLYYLPVDQGTERSPVCQRMFCFDLKTQTWSELPPLPEALFGVSAVMFEGKIVVEGATPQPLPSGEYYIPDTDEGVEERVYVYDPATGAWSQACSDNMIIGETIVNDDGQLRLVGGFIEIEEGSSGVAPCYNYDLTKGLTDKYCDSLGFARNPQAVAKDGVIYMYFPRAYFVVVLKDGEPLVLDGAIPEFAEVNKYEFPMMSANTPDDPFVGHGVLAVASDGIILVGPPAADGSSDTYILRDGSTTFEPYEMRASEARVQSVAACTYRGRLFAIGSSWVEPDQRFFRATEMDVPEYPGDIPCEEKEEPKPDDNPDPKHGGQLPKTGDDTPRVAIVVTGVAGLLLVGGGMALRRRTRSAR